LSLAVERSVEPHSISNTAPAPDDDEAAPSLAKPIVTYASYVVALAGMGAGVFFLTQAADHDDAADTNRALVTERAQGLGEPLRRQPCSGDNRAPFLIKRRISKSLVLRFAKTSRRGMMRNGSRSSASPSPEPARCWVRPPSSFGPKPTKNESACSSDRRWEA
jgi:hypothetical protein